MNFVGVSKAGEGENNLQGTSKESSDKPNNNCAEKRSRTPKFSPNIKIKYLLTPIKYEIKFLHPKYIPDNDPRRKFYLRKLEEFTYKRNKFYKLFKLIGK